jgi:hypothetical protein
MDLITIAEVATKLAVPIGLWIGVLQLRLLGRNATREATFRLINSFQTPEFAQALIVVSRLPDAATKQDVESSPENHKAIWTLMSVWESLGVAVKHGVFDLQLIEDFFSGPVMLSWSKLKGYVKAVREENRNTYWEWFEVLAKLIGGCEKQDAPEPAPQEYGESIASYIASRRYKHRRRTLAFHGR